MNLCRGTVHTVVQIDCYGGLQLNDSNHMIALINAILMSC